MIDIDAPYKISLLVFTSTVMNGLIIATQRYA